MRSVAQAEERLRILGEFFDSSRQAVVITALDGTIIDVNQAFCDITGFSRDEVLGENPRIMKSDRHDETFFAGFWRSLTETGQWQGQVWDRRRSGELYAKWLTVSTVRDDHGDPSHYVGMFSDITALKQNEERLEHLAHYDTVTGLPNRLLARDRLRQTVLTALRQGTQAAVLFLDLDGFKRVNDTLGHRCGDLVLSEAARRLRGAMRDNDTVSRHGGDEFLIVLPDVSDVHGSALVASKLLEALAEPYDIDGQEVRVTASIGIAIYPEDGHDLDVLIKNADTAMYHAKGEGRGGFRFFTEEMNTRLLERLGLETALRGAIDREEFLLHFQPRVVARGGEIAAVEALLRWQSPERGLVPPSGFLSLCEDSGLIVPVGEWVLQAACQQWLSWREAGLGPPRIAVNISARQVLHGDLASTVREVLEQTAMEPRWLELELTENVIRECGQACLPVLSELEELGVSLSIDDFGSGSLCLSSLRQLPADVVKIDRSLVADAGQDPETLALVRGMVAFARSLELRVVAEGVETAEQLELLRSLGCDEVQGFWVGPPVPPEQLAPELARRSVENLG